MKKFLFFSVLEAICLCSVFADKPPAKFGKVSKEELEMKIYDKDTSAPAVILCDYGYFDGIQFQFTRLTRIKILKKEGLSWSNYVLPTESKSEVRGITFRLEGANVVEDKLDKKSVFLERVTENRYRTRVAMPNVQVGSVIDIEYYFTGFPSEWKFQETIPVVWSELIIEESQYLRYQKNFFGYEQLFYTSGSRWIARDMPAFKEEPYINSASNYLTKFEFDILDINFPGFYRSFTNTWDNVAQRLRENDYFGKAIKGSAYLNGLAKEISEKNLSEEQKIEAAYNAIRENMKWNGIHSLTTSFTEMIFSFKKKSGNSADINIMLLQLLDKLGFEVYPVVLSTRDNGVLSPINPSLNKLNHVIVYVKTSKESLLIDATEDYMPYSLIPFKCINWQGRLIEKEKNEWIELKTKGKDKLIRVYNLALTDDLTMTGEMICDRFDYAAYDFRKDFGSYNSRDEFLTELERKNPGLKITSCDIENIDSLSKPVKERYRMTLANQVENAGNEFYLYPFVGEKWKENPFRNSLRKYPVDFGYKIEHMEVFSYTLPDNFEVVSLPQSLKISLPDNAASFICDFKLINKQLLINTKLLVNKEMFLPAEYPGLREFYDQMIKKQSEPIVLKKI